MRTKTRISTALIAVAVAVIVGITPGAATAQADPSVLAALQAQIQLLLQQISALQAQLASQGSGSGTIVVPPTTPPPTTNAPTVLSPNGGEVIAKGQKATLVWLNPSQEPVTLFLVSGEDKASTYFIASNLRWQAGDKQVYVWPDAGVVQGGSAAFTVPDGEYYFRVCTSFFGQSGNCDMGDRPFTLSSATQPPTSGLRLLSPNGGERWMLNSDKTVITWTPNPDSDSIVAYLERLRNGRFETLGRMIPAAKGSIVWLGELDKPGNYAPTGSGYYVRIVDRVTGASDRSDAPFTIVRADYFKVDLEINGSEGPVSVPENGGYVNISWIASDFDGVSCSFQPNDLGSRINGLSSEGSQRVFLRGNPHSYNYAVHMVCWSEVGMRSDYVEILPSDSPPPALAPVVRSVGSKAANPDEIYSGEAAFVTGSGFLATNTVYIGSTKLSVRSSNGTNMSFTTPSLPAGQYRFSVSNSNGTSASRLVTVSSVNVPARLDLTAPGGGETFSTGRSILAKWNYSGIDAVRFDLCTMNSGQKACKSVGPLMGVPAANGSYSVWLDPNHPYFPSKTITLRADGLKNGSRIVRDESGQFSVLEAMITPLPLGAPDSGSVLGAQDQQMARMLDALQAIINQLPAAFGL